MKQRLNQLTPRTLAITGSSLLLMVAAATGLMAQQNQQSRTPENKAESTEETEVRKRIDDWVNAFRHKDINAVLSIFAPDVVSFDVVPPLAYSSRDSYRKAWEDLFASYQGPIEYEIRDLRITADHDLAFSHSLNRISGTLNNGTKTGLWLRMTACWRKINGQWLMVHEHVSVPADLKHEKALLHLEPVAPD